MILPKAHDHEPQKHPYATILLPSPHPANTPRYLHGNFAPIQRCLPLTPCSFSGTIPPDLAGGQYVRNGGNPLTNADLGRDAHWFDGDGMLSGVLFRRTPSIDGNTTTQPEFVNQYLQTDVHAYASGNRHLRRPVLPSIATLVNPATSLLRTLLAVLRTLALVLLSRLGKRLVTRISVANTSCLYHDGRALATCESGPPLRFALPGLDTVGWYDGVTAENEPWSEKRQTDGARLGGTGALHWMREWTTAHPRVDPVTNELVSFHSMLVAPYVRYSVIQPRNRQGAARSIVDVPVPGITSPKMMHDFGVSRAHTVILDLPLSLDPLNPVLRGLPALHFDRSAASRFGVFPRHAPDQIRWFETSACTIFHTANCWDTTSPSGIPTVNLLACRMTSASLVFRAGNIPPPAGEEADDQCRLYYYAFDLGRPSIRHQWALSALAFEFPSVSPLAQMQPARYVYGCTTASGTYTAALGRAVKITHLVKFDATALIARGVSSPPAPVTGCVDTRSTLDVLAASDPNDAIRLFALPPGCYAQEPRFVPRRKPAAEDDGWLLTYVFDEAQLDDAGECPATATSELWIIDARTMDRVVARVRLPQRVPYGLHGSWFSEEDIEGQLPWTSRPDRRAGQREADGLWDGVREACERWVT